MTTSSNEIIHSIGPYEHTGPYAGSELFDTSGMSAVFCPGCEHDPCVAGATSYCHHDPRFIGAAVIAREIRNADLRWSPWQMPALLAVSELLQVAADRTWRGDSAMCTLADIRTYVRGATRAPKDES